MSLFDTTNATGTGKYINLKWKLADGMVFFSMYNFVNSNPVAQNIALAELGHLQVAAGGVKGPVESVEDLFGKQCVLTLVNESNSYGDQIKIKKYKPCSAITADPFI